MQENIGMDKKDCDGLPGPKTTEALIKALNKIGTTTIPATQAPAPVPSIAKPAVPTAPVSAPAAPAVVVTKPTIAAEKV